MNSREVPKSLKNWFLAHFIADLIFAIPLFLFPEFTLGLFKITSLDPATTRLVAAALIGIGGASLFSYNKNKESYNILLTLKILWSITAILGLIVSIILGESPSSLWIVVLIFSIFSITWIYYKIKLK
ncbi:hypothetical protein J4216_00150 [Candidatus Woesearchaeota archaeon]|nr:hypothetical protein [Candidatus Woesearchaeota archaeon]